MDRAKPAGIKQGTRRPQPKENRDKLASEEGSQHNSPLTSDHGDPTSPPLQPPSSVQPTLVEAPEGRAQKGDLQTLGASFGGVLKWRDEAKSRVSGEARSPANPDYRRGEEKARSEDDDAGIG
ncbi:tRNA (guanine-N-7) methyltransferase [Striga asiatica]|uniref:tRNA (Guanine-N-7) methyltransferase n=1 Tax=Striga asiatica TaxID=4170 RepID=A0A5A7Q3U1_STRAF|nr:tRNA (guanine-N-7) methyltransferase [Striga asiatica]